MGERAGVSLSQHEISVLHGPRRMTAAWTCHGPNDHQILERQHHFEAARRILCNASFFYSTSPIQGFSSIGRVPAVGGSPHPYGPRWDIAHRLGGFASRSPACKKP